MKALQNIILIGFMGTGKSTIGRRLSRALNWQFIDTDLIIEEVTGLTVENIFRRFGESRFRSEESLLVKKISAYQQCVISTGGGTVMDPENFDLLLNSGLVICLFATLETILQRVGSSDRPLLKRSPAEIEVLWQSRQETYARAHHTFDTTNKGVDEIANEILRLVEEGEDQVGKLAED